MIPQRIRAIKQRYFSEQVGKVLAPLQVEIKGVEGAEERRRIRKRIGLDKENNGLLGALERQSQVAETNIPMKPRRLQTKTERNCPTHHPQKFATPAAPAHHNIERPYVGASKWERPKSTTSRSMRRKYQSLLNNSPILVVEKQAVKVKTTKQVTKGEEERKTQADVNGLMYKGMKFSVRRSDYVRGGTNVVAEMSEEDRAWNTSTT